MIAVVLFPTILASRGYVNIATSFDSRQQADIFQQDLFHLILRQNHSTERALNIGIVGAGATGVELAAELIETTKNFYRYGLKKIDPKQVKITLIEASDRILPALNEKPQRIVPSNSKNGHRDSD